MPTISSRPVLEDDDDGDSAYSVDEIVEIIKDAVLYTMPRNMLELKLVLHVACRTLWNTGAIEDFYVHEIKGNTCDVGFKLHYDPHYNVIQIN